MINTTIKYVHSYETIIIITKCIIKKVRFNSLASVKFTGIVYWIQSALVSRDTLFMEFRSRQVGRKSSSCPIGRHITNARGVARLLALDQPFSPFNYYLITLIARRRVPASCDLPAVREAAIVKPEETLRIPNELNLHECDYRSQIAMLIIRQLIHSALCKLLRSRNSFLSSPFLAFITSLFFFRSVIVISLFKYSFISFLSQVFKNYNYILKQVQKNYFKKYLNTCNVS